MTTARIAKTIFGDKLYQERARRALPILVRQAQAQTPINYFELASEIGMTNPRNLNYVLGSIGQTLLELSDQKNQKIPPIQCIVLNKSTGLPGEGIGWFITGDKEKFKSLSRRQQRRIVDIELSEIYSYQNWYKILEWLSLEPINTDYSDLILKSSKRQGGGESDEHKFMKEFVSKHPELFSIPKYAESIIEFRLPSGDSIDVLFKTKKEWVAIEVKPEFSDCYDITRGLFQCIKYQALTEAYQALKYLPQNTRTLLVLGSSLPNELIKVKNILGIEVIENILSS